MKQTTDAIDLWPTIQDFANDAGTSVPVVYVWRNRGAIPCNRWFRLERAAAKRGIFGVTMQDLAKADETRKGCF